MLETMMPSIPPANMGAGWNKPGPSMDPVPKKTFVPAHWRCRLARPALDAAPRFTSFGPGHGSLRRWHLGATVPQIP